MPLIDPVRIKTLLGPLARRFDVDALDEVDSSSSELSRRADQGAPAGSVLVADRQSAGRGRRGRHWLSAPEDAVTLCRCEEVTAGQVRAAARLGATGPNQMKAYLRCGMGPCQGRLCGLPVTEVIAATRGQAPAATGAYRPRAPYKPLTVGELASGK